MFYRAMLLSLACLTLVAAAQTTTAPAALGYTGVISGTNVYVRSGPNDAYTVTKLSAPATVQVIGEEFGWLKILPPEGCFSLVAKDYVKASGATGSVTGNNVLVRAGSLLNPAQLSVIQVKLAAGDTVQILGEQGTYYKIVPPKGAYLYISSQYVKRGGEAAAELARGATTGPAATEPVVSLPPGTGRVMEVALDEGAIFKAAQEAMKAELAKPATERNYAALLRMFEAVKPADNSPYKPYVVAQMNAVRGMIDQLSDKKAVDDLVRDALARQEKYNLDRANIVQKQPDLAIVQTPAAEGLLTASELFPGGPTGPKRFAVRDPDSRLITAYVQCTTGGVDLNAYIGARVGIFGKPRYDEAVRLYVIEAERIQVIKPAVAPTPKVLPKAELPPVKPTPVAPAALAPVVPTTPAPTAPAAPTTEPAKATGLPVAEPTTMPGVGDGYD